jgi:hypothetical protein
MRIVLLLQTIFLANCFSSFSPFVVANDVSGKEMKKKNKIFPSKKNI